MTRKNIIESLWDNSIRIDSIIWLSANSSDITDELKEFLEYEEDKATQLLGSKPKNEGDNFEEYLSELCRAGKNGYLVQAMTPVRAPEGWYSWSACTSEWFYFEEWNEQAVTEALAAWVDSKRPKDQEANK